MFCAVQELATKKENKNGYPKRLEAYPETKIVDGKEKILWRYRYGTERLENASAKALSYTPNPSLKNISTILKNGQDGRVPVYPAVFLSLFSAFCTIILTSCLEFPLIQKWDSLRQFRIPASAYDTGLP